MQYRRTVILDWDGTLAAVIPDGIITRPVHAARAMEINLVSIPVNREGKPGKYLLILRPHLYELILTLSTGYNLVLWSFGVSEYINRCIDSTGLHKVFSRDRVIVREDMIAWDSPYKDVHILKNRLGIRMSEVCIVDDLNAAFGVLNPFNCVDIPTWTPDMRNDTCLKALPDLIERRFEIIERMGDEDLERRREAILKTL